MTNSISRKFSDHCFKNADIWKKNHLQKWTRVRHHFCVFWPPLWPLRLLLYILLYYKWTTLSIRCGWIIFLRTILKYTQGMINEWFYRNSLKYTFFIFLVQVHCETPKLFIFMSVSWAQWHFLFVIIIFEIWLLGPGV